MIDVVYFCQNTESLPRDLLIVSMMGLPGALLRLPLLWVVSVFQCKILCPW